MRRDTGAPGSTGASGRSRQSDPRRSSRFCQCDARSGLRSVTDRNQGVPVRHAGVHLPEPEELSVSSYPRPHLTLAPDLYPVEEQAPAYYAPAYYADPYAAEP